MTDPHDALAANRRTLDSYEGYAREYDEIVGDAPSPDVEMGLRRLIGAVGPDARILEVGSGPGRDADFLESLGARVRRTDATQAFLDIQAERGRQVEHLNLLTDELGGPYDGVMALCVLIHIDRGEVDRVLDKVAGALRPGGAFLVSVREGTGETKGDYHTILWDRDAFVAHLDRAGLRVTWEHRNAGRDTDIWLTFLAVGR